MINIFKFIYNSLSFMLAVLILCSMVIASVILMSTTIERYVSVEMLVAILIPIVISSIVYCSKPKKKENIKLILKFIPATILLPLISIGLGDFFHENMGEGNDVGNMIVASAPTIIWIILIFCGTGIIICSLEDKFFTKKNNDTL